MKDPNNTNAKKEAVLESLGNGASVLAACKAADVGRTTYYEWLKANAEFAAATKVAQRSAIDVIVDALFRRGKGYEYEEKTYKAVVGKDGQIKNERLAEVKKKQIAPDTTACIFFLANRDPDNWKSVNNVNLNHSGGVDTGMSDKRMFEILEAAGYGIPEEDRKKMQTGADNTPVDNDNGDNGDNGKSK